MKGVRPARGVLLYGPPGTGKTLLARDIAKSCGAKVFVVNAAAEIVGKYYGDTETKLKELFKAAIAAAPSLIFLDGANIDDQLPFHILTDNNQKSTPWLRDETINQQQSLSDELWLLCWLGSISYQKVGFDQSKAANRTH